MTAEQALLFEISLKINLYYLSDRTINKLIKKNIFFYKILEVESLFLDKIKLVHGRSILFFLKIKTTCNLTKDFSSDFQL